MKINEWFEKILDAVEQAERKVGSGGGDVKRDMAVNIVNSLIDVPYLPEWAEEKLIGMLIDFGVYLLNEKIGHDWIGKVWVRTRDGRSFESRIDEPKGDPGNTLSRAELEDKARRLAAFADGASQTEIGRVIARAWNLEHEAQVRDWLP